MLDTFTLFILETLSLFVAIFPLKFVQKTADKLGRFFFI